MMKGEMALRLAIFATAGMSVGLMPEARARTVALWPMEFDRQSGEVNLRCAVDNRNSMTNVFNGSKAADMVPWTLPPNPDGTEKLLFRPENRSAVTKGANEVFVSTGPEVARTVSTQGDFTLEGWVRPAGFKDGYWYILATGNGGSSYLGGWIWSIRRTRADPNDEAKKAVTFEIFSSTDHTLKYLTDAEAVDLTNAWHHVALTYVHNASSGKAVFSMFCDGQLAGTAEVGQTGCSGLWPSLEIGGRTLNVVQSLEGDYDYWRLSDEALGPASFLNAGGAGTLLPEVRNTTVAYWKLGCHADGTVDARDYAGHADLTLGLLETPTNLLSNAQPSPDCAFVGNPPNATVALPGGNAGSLDMAIARSSLAFPDLGDSLETTNSFTVEGWVRIDETFGRAAEYTTADTSGNRYFYVFNTRTAGNGWVLQLSEQPSGVRRFQLIAEDPAGGSYLTTAYFAKVVHRSTLADWTHLALVYDRASGDAGQGVWTLYGNGEPWGAVTNSHVVAGPSGGRVFQLGGRGWDGTSPDSFFGAFDCVRACRAALRPSQFLCARTDCEEATDVLALWPFNCIGELYLDARDVVGPYSVTTGKYDVANYRPAAVVGDEPTVVNPDTSVLIRSGDVPAGGSTDFNLGNRYLMSKDPKVVGLLSGRRDYTLEFYVKRAAAVNTWEILFVTVPSLNSEGTNPGARVNFSWRTNGFCLLDNTAGSLTGSTRIEDTAFPDSTGLDCSGEWMHIALTRQRTPDQEDAKVCYTLYKDGVKVSELKGSDDSSVNSRAVFFFGRPWSSNKLPGQVGAMRLSDAVLDPSQFLCGSVPLPRETRNFREGTIAYWPLEKTEGSLDALSRESRTAAGFSALPSGTGVTATDEVFRRSVPSPDTNLLERVRANVGSAALADGAELRVDSLGGELELLRPFTVEGWVKWVCPASDGERTLFGTYRSDQNCGWRLSVVTSGGVSSLRLQAIARGCWTPVADGTVVADISVWDGVWGHVALVYDPDGGSCGEWRLYRNRILLGTVENRWLDCRKWWNLHRFSLGGIAGGLDQFRVSDGALEPEAFLDGPIPGLIIVVR